jgi:hypothetical protein
MSSPVNANANANAITLPLWGEFSAANDKAVLTQVGNDKFQFSINGGPAITYTKEQLEALSAAGYFDGLGGNDSFEIDVWDADLELTVIGNDGKDSFTLSGSGGQRVAFHQDQGQGGGQGQGQGQGQGNGNGAASSGAPTNQGAPMPAPGAAATPAANSTGGDVVSNGAGNYVFNNSGPVNFTTTAVPSLSSNAGTTNLAGAVASGNSGLKETSPGVFSGTTNSGATVTATQPGGAGSPTNVKLTMPDGKLKGATFEVTFDADGKPSSAKVSGGNLTADETKHINDVIDKLLHDGLDNAFSSTKKKKGGGSSSTGAGAAAGGAGEGTMGAVDGSTSIDGGSGLDGTSGLDTGSNTADSWFLVLAEAMGAIMNKTAEKMIGLLNDIKAAGDNPPYALTMEFQATAQLLSYMTQSFMAALNALGESIKTSVTAGGAAR